MSTEKRLVLFLILSVGLMYGMQLAMDQMGLLPKPPKQPPTAQSKKAANEAEPSTPEAPADTATPDAEAPESNAEAEPSATAVRAAEPASADAPPTVALAEPGELVLGSTDPSSPYHVEVRFEQRGAGIFSLQSSRYEAEIQENLPRGRPLELIRANLNPAIPASFALNVNLDSPAAEDADGPSDPANSPDATLAGKFDLHERIWEVVRDSDGNAVRPAEKTYPDGRTIKGHAIAFRTEIESQGAMATVTKTYRLWPGEDGLELLLSFESSAPDLPPLTYTLLGPHGIPIEGEWYAMTFRDAFFGLVAEGGIEIDTISAYEVVKYAQPGREPERFTRPLAYAGIENQYFSVFAQPLPKPKSADESVIEEAFAIPVKVVGDDWQKADVSVVLRSKPISVGPNVSASHLYRIYAGPKTVEALSAVDAFDLSVYRKGWKLWVVGDLGASFMSKYFITPLLTRIHSVTERVAGYVGLGRGSWGFAIIALTVVVRLILFPLGRKQARAAQKMQELQPLMMELKEKYKDDKEKLTQETFALYRQYGVNPLGGCLPALVQLPVLIGLWQTLNNSVALRHSRFLWIDNLAAPDQLFKFPFDIPLIGTWLGPYFNVLPIVVVILMLIQTKLFSPPATTPEAEQQQKMMKYMMIFMAFMFYRVPSGLGIYFITSSLWQIGERLLLPKSNLALKPVGTDGAVAAERRGRSEGGSGASGQGARPRPKPGSGGGPDAPAEKGGWLSELRAKAQQIMDEAEKQRTVRKPGESEERDRDRNRPRPKPGRRR